MTSAAVSLRRCFLLCTHQAGWGPGRVGAWPRVADTNKPLLSPQAAEAPIWG